MKKRILWIDILRTIGIISIILLHIMGNTINTYHLSNNTYPIFINLLYFSIPLFIMLSGMYFLNKDISIKEMFHKYILRIFLVLIIFGSFYSLLELIFLNKSLSLSYIPLILKNILTGNLWAHMWYLYLVLALYIITPFLRIITKNITKQDYQILLIILFIFTILIPEINYIFKTNIAFFIPLSVYLFYYFYSAYLTKYNFSNKYKIISYILGIIAIILIILKVNIFALTYTSLLPFLISNLIFIIFMNKEYNNKVLTKISNLIGKSCLGIYLIHQFFINIIFKLLKIDFIIKSPYLGLIIYTFIVLILSLLTTLILNIFNKKR